jgi:hypothetical protein
MHIQLWWCVRHIFRSGTWEHLLVRRSTVCVFVWETSTVLKAIYWYWSLYRGMAINNSTQRHTISRRCCCTKSLKYTRRRIFFSLISERRLFCQCRSAHYFSRARSECFPPQHREQRGDFKGGWNKTSVKVKVRSPAARIMKCISRRAAHSSLSRLHHISLGRCYSFFFNNNHMQSDLTRCCVNNRS